MTMTTPLQVLLLESHPDQGSAVAGELAAAGHTVLRCHEAGGPAFPCVGVDDELRCPLRGSVDVTIDVRRPGATEPTSREDGVACSIRAGVPVVEAGGTLPSPFAPWTITAAADDDLAEACAAAAAGAYDGLAAAILDRLADVAARHGVEAGRLRCTVTSEWPVLRVRLSGPPLPQRAQQAFAVRAHDVLRETRHWRFAQSAFAYETEVEASP